MAGMGTCNGGHWLRVSTVFRLLQVSAHFSKGEGIKPCNHVIAFPPLPLNPSRPRNKGGGILDRGGALGTDTYEAFWEREFFRNISISRGINTWIPAFAGMTVVSNTPSFPRRRGSSST